MPCSCVGGLRGKAGEDSAKAQGCCWRRAQPRPSRGGGGNIEPQKEETAKSCRQVAPHAASRRAERRLSSFCTIWSQLASANEAKSTRGKGNKSELSRQHGEASVRMGKAPKDARAERPVTCPALPAMGGKTRGKGMGKQGEKGWENKGKRDGQSQQVPWQGTL